MRKCILVKSVTYAQKSRDILSYAGMPATIERRGIPSDGCAWCVTVAAKHYTEAMKLLSDSGIKLTGDVYDI